MNLRGPDRPRSGRNLILLAIMIGAAIAAIRLADYFTDSGAAAVPAGVGVVVFVIDGDTVDVTLDGERERVRLIGVDTPETVHPDKPAQCFGAEASAALKALLPPGTQVRLTRDDVVRDRFGRMLAYLYRVEDDLLINLALVEGGFADAVTFGDNEAFYRTFAAAEANARAGGVGLWGVCGGPDVDLEDGP